MDRSKLTIENVKELKSNGALIDAAAKYLVEQAKYEILAPQVDKVYNSVLEKYDFRYEGRRNEGDKITNYKLFYHTDANTDSYYQEANEALRSAGLMGDLKDGYCPKCVQEMKMINQEKVILDIVCKQMGLPELWDLKTRSKLLELTLALLLSNDEAA